MKLSDNNKVRKNIMNGNDFSERYFVLVVNDS